MPKTKKEKTTEKAEESPQEVEAKKKEKISMGDFEARVVELAKKGLTAEKIGEALRKEDIHSQEYGKISRILKAKGLYTVPEIKNLEAKLSAIEKHREKNMQDKRAMREKERIFSLLRKQKAYHKVA